MIKNCNFKRHNIVCDGSGKIKPLIECPHCKITIEELRLGKVDVAGHVKWCKFNPKKFEYLQMLEKSRSKISEISRCEAATKIRQCWKDGKYDHVQHNTFLGRTHSDKTKEKIRESALNSNHRRLKKNVQWYKGIMMDSSWEVIFAQRLDEIQIIWKRPDPIKWHDNNGKIHNYFPDFYLPEFDLYIDTKNKFAYSVQIEKIQVLLKTYNNLIFLTDLTEIKNFKIE